MKKILFIILFLLLSISFAQNNAKRIVSLGPSVTSQLSLLGAEDRIVGSTVYCDLNKNSKSERIGSLLEVDLEKILSLKPDVVFAVGLTPKRIINKLKKLGIKVAFTDDPASFEALCENLLIVARECGLKDSAVTIIDQAKTRLDSLRKTTTNSKRKSVLLQLGVNPVYATTKGTLGNELIEFSGGVNAFDLTGNGSISKETVIKRDPDVIIITDMGISAINEKKVWEKFTNLKAVKNNNIFIVDSHAICSPEPKIFVETVIRISKLLDSGIGK